MSIKAGQNFDRLTAVRPHGLVSRNWYWIFVCECGAEISRIPGHIYRNKNNACPDCLKGPGSWGWRGVGELAQLHYRAIYHSAQARNLEFAVSMDFLWRLFLSQDRKCAFTAWDLTLRKSKRTASLDRIDSTQGYVEGNVQWVHRDINRLKKNLPDERFIAMCLAVASGISKCG